MKEIRYVEEQPTGWKLLGDYPIAFQDDPAIAKLIARDKPEALTGPGGVQDYITQRLNAGTFPHDVKREARSDQFVYTILKIEAEPSGGATVTVRVWYEPQAA